MSGFLLLRRVLLTALGVLQLVGAALALVIAVVGIAAQGGSASELLVAVIVLGLVMLGFFSGWSLVRGKISAASVVSFASQSVALSTPVRLYHFVLGFGFYTWVIGPPLMLL